MARNGFRAFLRDFAHPGDEFPVARHTGKGVVRVAVGRRPGGTRSSTPWFLVEPDPDARVRVFCFPYSGCGASMYQRWPSRIGGVDFVPVQFPFRENRTREPHFGTYEELADVLVPGIGAHLDRPYVFFSHCGGVLPAYESALRTAELGLRPPSAFIASSQVVPHHGPYGRFLGLSVPELDEEIRTLLRRTGSRETFSDEIIEIVREVLVADLDANRKYSKPAPAALPCPVTAVGWDHDVDIPSPLMDAWTECADDVDVVLLHGDHYSFLEAPAELVDLIAGVAEDAAT